MTNRTIRNLIALVSIVFGVAALVSVSYGAYGFFVILAVLTIAMNVVSNVARRRLPL